MKPLVSVVVPLFNEVDNVRPLLDQVHQAFAGDDTHDYECLFVNDGSADGTAALLDELARGEPRLRPIHLARNLGQSAAIYAGLQAARGDYIVTMDGDLQNDPADVPKVLALLAEHDCVCGYRATRHDSWVRRISSRIANRARNAVLHDGVRDTGCGLKGFRRVCLPHFVPVTGLPRFFPAFVRVGGLSVVELPVQHRGRVAGVSKYGIGNRLWPGLFDLIGVAWLRRRYLDITLKDTE